MGGIENLKRKGDRLMIDKLKYDLLNMKEGDRISFGREAITELVNEFLKLEAQLATYTDGVVASFEELCCSQCYSPRMEHDISDAHLSECNECGHTTSTKDLEDYKVIVRKLKQ